MKNSFLIYHEYREILADLTNEQLGILFRALFDYEIDNKIPQFTGLLKMAFLVIKGNLDRDRYKYDKRCETSARNGFLGGRPRKSNENLKKPNSKPKKPKKPDNDNETDTDNDNETDTDNDNETGTDTENETSADLFDSEADESKTNADLFTFIESAFGRTLNSIEYELISTWKDNELTRYAVKESILNGARGIRYVQTVLSSWEAKGFKTVQDVQAYQKKYKSQSKKNVQREEHLPEWFDKQQESEEMTEEEQQELDSILKSITGDVSNVKS